ncbi:MAG: class I SAM-dependent methyltransferase [Thermoanaerobaculia bacterium]
MERLAFGGALERARFAHVDALRTCRSILLLGDGDGRFLERLLAAAPGARVHSVDASAAMLALAAARVAPADRVRVKFENADARTIALPLAAYDAVATLFFLDCFTPEETRALVTRVAGSIRPGGQWLFADFAVPEGGWRRCYSRVVVGGLYAFFRWRARISARRLPDSERTIAGAGFRAEVSSTLAQGLLRSVLFRGETTSARIGDPGA